MDSKIKQQKAEIDEVVERYKHDLEEAQKKYDAVCMECFVPVKEIIAYADREECYGNIDANELRQWAINFPKEK